MSGKSGDISNYDISNYDISVCTVCDVFIQLCHGKNQMYHQKVWLIGNNKSIGSNQADITIKTYTLW